MGGKQKFNTELCGARVVVDFLSNIKVLNMRGRIKVTDILQEENLLIDKLAEGNVYHVHNLYGHI